MATDYEVGRDFTVSSAGAIWTNEGIARMLKSGDLQPLHTPPQVHRIVGEAALTAISAAMPDVPVFFVPAAVAATFQEGHHYARVGCGHDWTAEGYAALRQAGWSGELLTLPEVADVIGRVASAVARPHAPAAISPAPVASPRLTSATSAALPTRPVTPAAAKPSAPIAALDMARILARSRRGDEAFAKMQPAQVVAEIGPDPSTARTMGEASSLWWARYRNRQAAGLCGRNGTPLPRTDRPRALPDPQGRKGYDWETTLGRHPVGAENQPSDLAALYARRRNACIER